MEGNELGNYLRSLRLFAGFSQEYVASKIYVAKQTYSAYETGRITPPAPSIVRLVEFYQVPAESLLRLTVPPALRRDDIKTSSFTESTEDLKDYLDFISKPENEAKFRRLTSREKRLMYYLNQLTLENRKKVLEQIKVEVQYQKLSKPAPQKTEKPSSVVEEPKDSDEQGKK